MKYLGYILIGLFAAVVSESENISWDWVVITTLSGVMVYGGFRMFRLLWAKNHDKISLNILVRMLAGYGGLVAMLFGLLGLAVGIDQLI